VLIAEAGLDRLYAVLADVMRTARLATLEMKAVRYGYTPGPGTGVAGIWAEASPALLELQGDVIAAAQPFMVETDGIEAFTADHGNPVFDKLLIDYVTHFVAKAAGAHFEPHVSTGVASIAYLDAMMAEPFAPFPFGCVSAAVYQLGPFGTAAQLMKRWEASG
jgi:hypothetical protein